MKFPWTLVAVLVTLHLSAATTTPPALIVGAADDPSNRWSVHSEELIKERVQRISLPFEVQYNEKVKHYIKDYVATGYRQTEDILGRSLMYFPIFEHYLAVHKLPKELMYLPIVESALDPTADSPAGAAGLWQLMRTTAKQYGLKMNESHDERYDPYRSTEAAVKILADLYRQFKDWRLVLVAYNCGPGKLQAAMRAANCKDYWELEAHLPAETRRYVPAYIAAAYVVNYYNHHNLKPEYPSLSMREVRVVKVYQEFTFQEIAAACGIAPKTLALLNPAYTKQAIPLATNGSFLVLPADLIPTFKNFLAGKTIAKGIIPPPNTFQSTYVVAKGERIEAVAAALNCTVEELVKWNRLLKPSVFVNQELIVFLPSAVQAKRA